MSTLAGLLLLAGASALAPRGHADEVHQDVRPAKEPLAIALQPLGPAKAVLSALLWERVQQQRRAGEIDSAVPLSRALLALHPGLHVVREHLATRLILGDASRAPDQARYRALVFTGLSMLEEGHEAGSVPQLHEAMGHLLAIQGRNDGRFWEVASEYFGAAPEDIAIQELRVADNLHLGALLLADLLLDRGFSLWEVEQDAYGADRDLAEAQKLIEGAPQEDTGFVEERQMLGERIAELRQRIADENRVETGLPDESSTGARTLGKERESAAKGAAP
ncbi:MAG: hypothetical protein ACI9EF_000964 [Pseudohongiellaceae bacterium]|jgi:hypothetical protein